MEITVSEIRLAILFRIIKFVKCPVGTPYGFGEVVCQIGSYWFYFTDMRMGQFKSLGLSEQANIIHNILIGNVDVGIYEDELNYYRAVILESLKVAPRLNKSRRIAR